MCVYVRKKEFAIFELANTHLLCSRILISTEFLIPLLSLCVFAQLSDQVEFIFFFFHKGNHLRFLSRLLFYIFRKIGPHC